MFTIEHEFNSYELNMKSVSNNKNNITQGRIQNKNFQKHVTLIQDQFKRLFKGENLPLTKKKMNIHIEI